MNRLLTVLKPFFCALAMMLLTAGGICLAACLGTWYYGGVSNPDDGSFKVAGIGLACLVAAIALDRATGLISDAPGESGRGFPVEFTSDVSRTVESPPTAQEPKSPP